MSNKIIVTTGDHKNDYEILGPVYFSVSNKGIFGSQLATLVKKYKTEIETLKKESLMSIEKIDWGVLWGRIFSRSKRLRQSLLYCSAGT